MKKFAVLALAGATLALTGCSTIFTGTHQQIQVRTHNDVVDTKLDNVAKFTVIADKYRVKYNDLEAGEIVGVHRKGAPIVVRIEESACIMPSEEHFAPAIHPAVLLDVLATSLLSTSIDSSTGAAWRYDKTLHVTPRIKDTPECRKWLQEVVAKMPAEKTSVPSEKESIVNHGGFPYDESAVRHQQGYELEFKTPAVKTE